MKRIIVGIWALIYLLVTNGMLLSMHYCMGKITGTSYNYHDDGICHNCGMKNKKDCCHTEYKVIRLTDDQQPARVNFAFATAYLSMVHQYTFNLLLPVQGTDQKTGNLYHSPPDTNEEPLYLVHCIFRI